MPRRIEFKKLPDLSQAQDSNCYVSVTCDGCSLCYMEFFGLYWKKDREFITYLQQHGVIATAYTCPKCYNPCEIDSTRNRFICRRRIAIPKKKGKIPCNFDITQEGPSGYAPN